VISQTIKDASDNYRELKAEEARQELFQLLEAFPDGRFGEEMDNWSLYYSMFRELHRLLIIGTRESVMARVLMGMIVPDDKWLPFHWPRPGYHHGGIRDIRYEFLTPELLQLMLQTVLVSRKYLHASPHGANFRPNPVLLELMVRLPAGSERDAAALRFDVDDFAGFRALMLRPGVPRRYQHAANDTVQRRILGDPEKLKDYAKLVRDLARLPALPCSQAVFNDMAVYLVQNAEPGTLHGFFSDTLTALLDRVTIEEYHAYIVYRLLYGKLACPGGELCHVPADLCLADRFPVDTDYCGSLSVNTDEGIILARRLIAAYSRDEGLVAALQDVLAPAQGRLPRGSRPGGRAAEQLRKTVAALCTP
jgi:hypothetical protein